MSSVSVCITSIPPRRGELRRALASICSQTRLPEEVIVQIDHEGVGAAANRNKALAAASGEIVCILDDDDEYLPTFIEATVGALEVRPEVALVYPDWEGINTNLFWLNHPEGGAVRAQEVDFEPWVRQVLIETMNFVPVTVAVRREAILNAGGFVAKEGINPAEEWSCWQAMLALGYAFYHLHSVEWRYNFSRHTSGRAWR